MRMAANNALITETSATEESAMLETIRGAIATTAMAMASVRTIPLAKREGMLRVRWARSEWSKSAVIVVIESATTAKNTGRNRLRRNRSCTACCRAAAYARTTGSCAFEHSVSQRWALSSSCRNSAISANRGNVACASDDVGCSWYA